VRSRDVPFWLTLLAALAVLGCETPVEEGLVVNLQSDFVPGVEFTSIEVSVDAAAALSVNVTSRHVFSRPRVRGTECAGWQYCVGDNFCSDI